MLFPGCKQLLLGSMLGPGNSFLAGELERWHSHSCYLLSLLLIGLQWVGLHRCIQWQPRSERGSTDCFNWLMSTSEATKVLELGESQEFRSKHELSSWLFSSYSFYRECGCEEMMCQVSHTVLSNNHIEGQRMETPWGKPTCLSTLCMSHINWDRSSLKVFSKQWIGTIINSCAHSFTDSINTYWGPTMNKVIMLWVGLSTLTWW